MPARRAPAEFSLSFLDVICCGFGAVILLLMITKTVQPQVIEQAMVDAESAVAELTEQLFEIRGETTILNRDLNVKREQISEYDEKIAILQGTLARTRSEYDALSTSQNANAIIREQLAIARQNSRKRSYDYWAVTPRKRISSLAVFRSTASTSFSSSTPLAQCSPTHGTACCRRWRQH